MYGDNYAYRSGLIPSMVRHLQGKEISIAEMVKLNLGNVNIDIVSNDSTTLQPYPPLLYKLAGIDPIGQKFKRYYPPHV